MTSANHEKTTQHFHPTFSHAPSAKDVMSIRRMRSTVAARHELPALRESRYPAVSEIEPCFRSRNRKKRWVPVIAHTWVMRLEKRQRVTQAEFDKCVNQSLLDVCWELIQQAEANELSLEDVELS